MVSPADDPADPVIAQALDEANGWLAQQGLEMDALVAHPVFKVIATLSAEHAVRTSIEEIHNTMVQEITNGWRMFRFSSNVGPLLVCAQRWAKP